MSYPRMNPFIFKHKHKKNEDGEVTKYLCLMAGCNVEKEVNNR
jgi:hypothetical protein